MFLLTKQQFYYPGVMCFMDSSFNWPDPCMSNSTIDGKSECSDRVKTHVAVKIKVKVVCTI